MNLRFLSFWYPRLCPLNAKKKKSHRENDLRGRQFNKQEKNRIEKKKTKQNEKRLKTKNTIKEKI